MSGLVVIAVVLACIAAYLLEGWHLAMKQLPVSRVKAARAWTFEDSIKGSVKAQTICIFLLWPLIMTVRLASARLGDVIDSRDPAELARKLAERDRHIAQLEREAGIRR